MINNDVLRSLRNLLDIRDQKVFEITTLANSGSLVDEKEFSEEEKKVVLYLKKESDPDFLLCPDVFLENFLDGLIIYKRGAKKENPDVAKKSDDSENSKNKLETNKANFVKTKLDNNLLLKKIRIAFDLKEDDVFEALKLSGFSISKSEINALFRSPNHRNFRPCGDQVLRYFLKGLTQKLRGPATIPTHANTTVNKVPPPGNSSTHNTVDKKSVPSYQNQKEFAKPKLRTFKDD